jgi:HEAT repeat protein
MALGDIGDEEAVGPLIEALNDEWAQVRRAALVSLKLITDEDFGEDYGAWKEWYDTEFKKAKKGNKKKS